MPSITTPFRFRPTFRPLNPSTFCQKNGLRNTQIPRITSPIPSSSAPFSVTANMQKRKKGGQNTLDPRITQIRYHLMHPKNPRPLHLSRDRFLRHWTIHRAWMLFMRKRRWNEERELERQYMSMREACEALRLLDENGNRVSEEEAGGFGPDAGKLGVRGKEVGRLYRYAMVRKGLDGSVPIEYARAQVDYPSRDGWNHGWTRAGGA